MHRQRTFLSQTSSAKSNTSKSGSPEPILHPYDELDMDLDRDLSQSQSSLPPLVSKLRNRLSLKSTRAAFAEREILKRENRAARPLTQRNVDTFVIEQDLNDARVRRAENLHVSQWLQNLP